MLRIRDVYPGSRIRIFSIPDTRSVNKNSGIVTKKIVLSSRKYDPGGSYRIRILIPEPGVKKAPDPGSGSATLNFYYYTERACTRGEAEKNLATSAFFFSRSAAFLRWWGARGRREGAAGDGVFSAELKIGHTTGLGTSRPSNFNILGTVYKSIILLPERI